MGLVMYVPEIELSCVRCSFQHVLCHSVTFSTCTIKVRMDSSVAPILWKLRVFMCVCVHVCICVYLRWCFRAHACLC